MTVTLIQEELVEAPDGESASAKVLGWERDQVYADFAFDKIMFSSDFNYTSKVRGQTN